MRTPFRCMPTSVLNSNSTTLMMNKSAAWFRAEFDLHRYMIQDALAIEGHNRDQCAACTVRPYTDPQISVGNVDCTNCQSCRNAFSRNSKSPNSIPHLYFMSLLEVNQSKCLNTAIAHTGAIQVTLLLVLRQKRELSQDVCPSVPLSHSRIASKRLTVSSFSQKWTEFEIQTRSSQCGR